MAKQTNLQRLTDQAIEQRFTAAYKYLKECVAQYSSNHPRTISAQKAYTNITKERLARKKRVTAKTLTLF